MLVITSSWFLLDVHPVTTSRIMSFPDTISLPRHVRQQLRAEQTRRLQLPRVRSSRGFNPIWPREQSHSHFTGRIHQRRFRSASAKSRRSACDQKRCQTYRYVMRGTRSFWAGKEATKLRYCKLVAWSEIFRDLRNSNHYRLILHCCEMSGVVRTKNVH